jgi:hypothetical protein
MSSLAVGGTNLQAQTGLSLSLFLLARRRWLMAPSAPRAIATARDTQNAAECSPWPWLTVLLNESELHRGTVREQN